MSAPRKKNEFLPRRAFTPHLGATALQDRIGSPNPGAQENRQLLVAAMANPSTRRIAFDVVERNCRDRFKDGDAGIELYLDLFAVVEASGVQEAAQEFENRFAPMLDQELLREKLQLR
jgi:hypothetical protein